MSFIGKKILNLKARGQKNRRLGAGRIDFDSSKSFGLFYTWGDAGKMDGIETLKSQLNDIGKEVDILCYHHGKEDIYPVHPFFSINQINSLGQIKSDAYKQFVHKQFDYLIVLDFSTTEITNHLLSKSNATYRVGVHDGESVDHYDLLVNVNPSAGIEKLIAQLLKYIKVIRHE